MDVEQEVDLAWAIHEGRIDEPTVREDPEFTWNYLYMDQEEWARGSDEYYDEVDACWELDRDENGVYFGWYEDE